MAHVINVWDEVLQDYVPIPVMVGPQGPQGPTGATGAQGPQGPEGPQGQGFAVLGYFPNASDLSSIVNPDPGDAYGIGVTDPYDIYIYDGVNNTWVNNGPLQGAKGDTGAQGPAATITLGTVSTGAAGSNVVITNSGTPGAAVFNFTIPKGDKGDTGPQGSTGAQGPAGSNGTNGTSATVTLGAVSTGAAGSNVVITNTGTTNDAVFNFTIPKGDKGDKGDTGSQGIQGIQGPSGAAATIAVGTVTTVDPDDPATVTNTGSSSAAVFAFEIPKGEKGDTGATGSTGPSGAAATIAVGTVATVDPDDPATVTNTGTSSAAVFAFEIPKGEKGDTGATGSTGPSGAAATIAIGNVTTVSSGSPATVTNAGTSSAAVFDFEIPQGANGTNGTNGADGAAATIAVGTVTSVSSSSPATVTNVGTSNAAIFNFEIPKGEDGDPLSVLEAYPVGSIYLAYNHTSPAQLFGGTWTRMEDVFLWAGKATDTIGAKGGAATHTLTTNEMPSHRHDIQFSQSATAVQANGSARPPYVNNTNTLTNNSATCQYTGGGQAHNNMPPYETVSVWRRTA